MAIKAIGDTLNLEEMGSLCFDYLVRNIKSDGLFIYSVNSVSGRVSVKYNLLRHAGTVYEMSLWLRLHPDKKSLTRLQLAVDYLLKQVRPWDNFFCLVEDNWVKLGGAALALLALTEYENVANNSYNRTIMEGLASFITSVQKKDGSFFSKFEYSSRSLNNFNSEYYSGQAVLALTIFYKRCGGSKWLDAAKLGASNLILRQTPYSFKLRAIETWVAKAIWELETITPTPSYQIKLKNIINANLISLYGINIIKRDRSIETEKFTSASIASVGEALIVGYKMQIHYNEKPDRIDLKTALRDILFFCNGLQIKHSKNEHNFF